MDIKYLVEWIQENAIIEHIFQSKMSDMHPELIKRSKAILRLLASEKCLTTAHLDIIWKAANTQHVEPGKTLFCVITIHLRCISQIYFQHTKNTAVYETLGAICSNFPPEHQLHLLELIYSIPFADYTPRTITLITQLQNSYTTHPAHTEIKVRAKPFTLLINVNNVELIC